MTQLVQLQNRIETFAAEGFKIYAISYDPPEAVAKFAASRRIEYDVLSDEDSEVIRRYGILNTLISPEDEAFKHPSTGKAFYGIPFPGTFVTDENGIVTEKFFDRHYATRASAGTILDKAISKVLVHDESLQTVAQGERAKIKAFLSDEDLKLEVKSTLYIRLEVAEGLHVYGEPLPEGFIPTTVEIKPIKGVRLYEPEYPKTHPIDFKGLGVKLNVYEHVVDIAVPLVATAEVRGWGVPRSQNTVALEARVTYQVCSDTVCFAPESVDLTLEVPLDELIRPGR
uniref:AhpC/TSA family protein n=1 Tax=uncultured bacterium FLS18 TaxID=654935 RepID=C6G412_9BACT|nr:AhpC/TSA family protein [uncultured bacterium FLS18]